MPDTTMRIELAGGAAVTALRTTANNARWTLVYAPGAGSNIHDPFGAYAARVLAGQGVATVRFQFPYMEAGRRSPDRTPTLDATWRAVIEGVRDPRTRLVVGGRSMGGRIASMVVADGVQVDALALFAYPLHPPGKPEQLRTEHLASIKAPTIFVSGTNDAFGAPEELRAASKIVSRAQLHLLEHADHGFAIPKSSGRTRDDVWAEAVTALTAWITAIE